MTIISKQNPIISMIMGEQSVDATIEYRWMYFVSFKKVENNRLLLLNNFTREFLVLDPEEYSISSDDSFCFTNEIKIELIKKWFMVPISYNEKRTSQEIRALARQLESNQDEIDFYNIFTTTSCNARCFYCFEAGARIATMTTETAYAVADYIISHCGNKPVRIHWFGGEPMCNYKVITIICEALKNAGIIYSCGMTSNGYLFDDELVALATSIWKLDYIQITLDGLQKTYNRIKSYKNDDKNPFLHVTANIEKLLKAGVTVRVRMNMDLYNKAELYQLVDYLAERYGSFKNFSAYSNLIFENVGFVKTNHDNDDRNALWDDYLKLQEYIRDKSLLKMKGVDTNITTFACLADRKTRVMISPDGNCGNCERHLDDDFFGSVFDNAPVQPWTEYITEKSECDTCEIYPICIRTKGCHPEWEVAPEYDCKRRLWENYEAMRVSYSRYRYENPAK